MENIFCPFTVFSADIPMLHVNTHEQLQQRAHFLCFPKIVKKSLFSCTMNGYFSECPFSDSHIARSRTYNTYIIQSAAHIAFMPPHSVILPKTWKECDWFFSRLSIVSKFPSFFSIFSSKYVLCMLQRYEIPFLCEKERKVIFNMHTKQRLKIHKLRCNNFTYLPPYLSFYPTNFGWLMSLEAQYYKVRYCLLHILYLLYIFGHQSAIMGAEICKTLMTVFCPLIFPWKRERTYCPHNVNFDLSNM